MDYNKLKEKLKETGRSWASEIAEELECSTNLVHQVCSGLKPDRKGIIPKAIEKIEAYKQKQDELQSKLKQIA